MSDEINQDEKMVDIAAQRVQDMLRNADSDSAETPEHSQDQLAEVGGIFSELFSSHINSLMVTNMGQVKSNQTVYYARFTTDKMVYLEESKVVKNNYEYDLSTSQMSMNGEEVESGFIPNFLSKLQQMSRDINDHEVMVLEEHKNDI